MLTANPNPVRRRHPLHAQVGYPNRGRSAAQAAAPAVPVFRTAARPAWAAACCSAWRTIRIDDFVPPSMTYSAPVIAETEAAVARDPAGRDSNDVFSSWLPGRPVPRHVRNVIGQKEAIRRRRKKVSAASYSHAMPTDLVDLYIARSSPRRLHFRDPP